MTELLSKCIESLKATVGEESQTFKNSLPVFLSVVLVLALGFSCTSRTPRRETVPREPSPSAVFATATPTATQTDLGAFISVVGHIVTIGNDPFTQWAIETPDGKVYGLTSVSEDRLREFGLRPEILQAAKVEVKGYLMGRTSPSFRTEKSIRVIDIKVVNE